VHAWQLRPSEWRGSGVRERLLSQLAADERARYEELGTEAMRETYLASRVLCRVTLSRYTGAHPLEWRFGKGPYDKPILIEPDRFASLRFNLTHTDDLVILAVTRAGEVGVDAEETSRPVDVSLVARHFLSRRQEARLAKLAPRERAARFYEQWVLKEAYVKATGKGLANTIDRLTIDQADDGTPIAIGDCQFSLCRPDSNYVAAAAAVASCRAGSLYFEWLVASNVTDIALSYTL
jgi:4'-phosphopantetheinyl transferase